MFGAPATPFGAAPAFGAATTPGAFGAAPTPATPFGAAPAAGGFGAATPAAGGFGGFTPAIRPVAREALAEQQRDVAVVADQDGGRFDQLGQDRLRISVPGIP